jgi:acyl-coenzyme A thioesterase PaaI-like protein
VGGFLSDTRPVIDPTVPGRYSSMLGEDWKAFFAFGGATMGAAIRAMDARVGDPGLSPVSVHAQFLSPVPCGGLTIDTELVRAGRSVQQLAATLRPDDAPEVALRLQGTWGRHDNDDVVTGLGVAPIDVPGPDGDALLPGKREGTPFSSLPMHTHFEERRAPGWAEPGAFFEDDQRPESAVWTRLRDGHRTSEGTFVPAVIAVIADRAPGPHLGFTISGSVDHDIPARPMVTLELAVRFVAEPVGDWLLLHGTVVEAARRYITTRVVMWDENQDLIAIADQVARFAGRVVTD